MAVNWNAQRVLVVGVGSAGRRHARILRDFGIRELWICDPSEEQREACKEEGAVTREFSAIERAIAAQPDAAILCTHTETHVPLSIDALNAGIHVLCEKPLSTSLKRVDELERAIERSGKVFAVAFCFRFHEGIAKAKEYLDAGRIGDLVSIRCFMGENIDEVMPPQQSAHYKKIGGAFELVHEIDLACWLAGHDVAEVQCIHGAYSDLGFAASDTIEINIRFGERCIGSVHLDFFARPRTRVTELRGTQGTIAIEFARWDECVVSVYDVATGSWNRESMATDRDHMFRSEDEEFLRAIVEGTPVTCPLSEALKSQRILEEAKSSRQA